MDASTGVDVLDVAVLDVAVRGALGFWPRAEDAEPGLLCGGGGGGRLARGAFRGRSSWRRAFGGVFERLATVRGCGIFDGCGAGRDECDASADVLLELGAMTCDG